MYIHTHTHTHNTLSRSSSFNVVTLIFIYPAVGTAVPSRAWEEVDGIVAQVRGGSLAFKAGMAALNQSLKQIGQVQWWGPMTDLLKGSGAFQERVRGWFRETTLGTDDKGPLNSEEHAAFFEELRFWGA